MPSLYFTASWCSVCKSMRPIIEQLQKENYDIRIINSDEEKTLTTEYEIESLPTIVIIKDKKEVKRFVGKVSVSELRKHLTKKAQEYKLW